jgi:hypothetical protein
MASDFACAGRHSALPTLVSTSSEEEDESIKPFSQLEVKAVTGGLAHLRIDCSADSESNEMRGMSNSADVEGIPEPERGSAGWPDESSWE